jgi:hypothetical protein
MNKKGAFWQRKAAKYWKRYPNARPAQVERHLVRVLGRRVLRVQEYFNNGEKLPFKIGKPPVERTLRNWRNNGSLPSIEDDDFKFPTSFTEDGDPLPWEAAKCGLELLQKFYPKRPSVSFVRWYWRLPNTGSLWDRMTYAFLLSAFELDGRLNTIAGAVERRLLQPIVRVESIETDDLPFLIASICLGTFREPDEYLLLALIKESTNE